MFFPVFLFSHVCGDSRSERVAEQCAKWRFTMREVAFRNARSGFVCDFLLP